MDRAEMNATASSKHRGPGKSSIQRAVYVESFVSSTRSLTLPLISSLLFWRIRLHEGRRVAIDSAT